MSFFRELKRRNVIRVTSAYAVTAWLIIQVAETVLPFFEFSDATIRNVIVLLALGFIPVVILAWVFQLTPQGIRRDSGRQEALSDPGVTRNLDRAIIVVLLLGISYFAFDKFVLEPQRATEREAEVAEQATAAAMSGYYGDLSIAVMPFDNMSADPDQQFLVDGITEELLNRLARIRQLRVISRSSSFALRGLGLPVPEIAGRLNVAHLLEGSVRKIGNTVRVTVQLIEARTDTQLWSEIYERDIEDVFAIQDEIATDVAKNLKIELLRPLPASRSVDPDAIALTQQARMIGERQPLDAGLRMSEFVDRAIEIDPDYSGAWELKVWAELQLLHDGVIDEAEFRHKYQQARLRILELDPQSAVVDTTDGLVAMIAGRFEEAARLFDRAIVKAPNKSDSATMGGGFARLLGKFDVAIQLGKHAVAIDPLCYFCLWQLSRTYMYSGDYDASLEIRKRYLALGVGGEYHYGLTMLLQGEAGEALDFYQDLEAQPFRTAGLAMAQHDLGEHSNAEDALTRLISTVGDTDELLVAQTAAWMGKRDIAFEWLQKAASNNAAWELSPMDPVFRRLHADPRWDEFVESIGFSPARLDAIEFDPILPR